MILVRHGQSEFNVHYAKTRQDPGIRDPKITPLGREQALAAAAVVAPFAPRRIVASPFQRTLETAEILADALELDIEVNPIVHEWAASTAEIGTPRSRLIERWSRVDFGGLPELWWPESEEEHHVDLRARRFRDEAVGMGDWRHVLVVTHWGFIRALTGCQTPNCGVVRFDPHHDHPGGGVVVHPQET